MKKISIIVSTHNRSKFLEESIKSYPNDESIEILIMENGSTKSEKKNYAKVVSGYKTAKLYNIENGNLPASRNEGIKKATGKYIFLIDDDDLITEEFKKFLIGFNGDKNIYRFPYKRYNKVMKPTHLGKIRTKSIYNVIEVSTWLTKRSFINDNHIKFNESFWWGEDQFFAAKMFNTREKQNYINISSILYDFSDNDNSMVRMSKRSVVADFKIFEFLGNEKFDLLVRIKQLKTSIRYFNEDAYEHEYDLALEEIIEANNVLIQNKMGLNLSGIKKRN